MATERMKFLVALDFVNTDFKEEVKPLAKLVDEVYYYTGFGQKVLDCKIKGDPVKITPHTATFPIGGTRSSLVVKACVKLILLGVSFGKLEVKMSSKKSRLLFKKFHNFPELPPEELLSYVLLKEKR